MSLAIDTMRVVRVLLADGWHDIAPRSFSVDSYEYVEHGLDEFDKVVTDVVLGGGQCDLVPSTGFSFIEGGCRRIDGPLTSVLAVELRTGK